MCIPCAKDIPLELEDTVFFKNKDRDPTYCLVKMFLLLSKCLLSMGIDLIDSFIFNIKQSFLSKNS